MPKPLHSDTILTVVELFLDTAPTLEGVDIKCQPQVTGEDEAVRMMTVTIDGDEYLVVAKKVGGARG